MDQPQFDAFSRRVNRALGRRSLLRAAIVATALPGSEILTGRDAVGKRKKRKKCRPPRVKCGKTCLPAGGCCNSTDCRRITGQVCVAESCECPEGQVVTDNTCAVPCDPACSDCQRCVAGVCIDVADGAACTDGGVCRNNVCKPDLSLGCSAAQDSCGPSGSVLCPDSQVNNLFCFVDADSDPVCGRARCTNDTTGAECQNLTGVGSFVVPCAAICGAPDINKTHMCVGPPVQ